MLTVEDVAAVALFSTLPRGELERLARTSADLHLSPGEFAVAEGGERALFAVLSGKIEVTKRVDGIEATRRMLAGARPPVVVLVSTYDRTDLPDEVTTSGAAAYLHKEELTAHALAALWAEHGPTLDA